MNATPSHSTQPPSIRWWPAAVILLLAVGNVVRIWLGDDSDAQAQTMRTIGTVLLACLLLVLWVMLASRLPWRRRLAVLAALVVATGSAAVLFEIEGVTGNLVPIVTWRFGGEPVLGELSGSAQTATTPWDSPQFLGPRRDGVFPDAGLSTDWESMPPRELWRREVGDAWSGFAVVGETAVTMEQRQGGEWVVAYVLKSGEPLWSHSIAEVYESVIGGHGPRATPTIAGGTVFTYGSSGVLRALSLADGRLLWHQDVQQTHGARIPEWGYAGSPLVTPDGLVVVVAGGDGQLFVAYDAETGEKAWQGGSDSAMYASPAWMEIGGVPQIVTLGDEFVTSVEPRAGRTLWQAEFETGHPKVAQPMQLKGDLVLASAGYGVGSKLYRVSPPASEGAAWSVEKLWDSPRLKSKFANFVQRDGVIYGLDDGVLVAIDPQTGERHWKKGRYGHGQILLVGDTILVQSEDGELLLVEATPEEHRELARMTALSDKSWNQPALSGRYLLVRNHKEAAVYELPIEG
ncbi:MAG: PQQ-like beta-propeller repeat protein [Thermoanaerobaculia bacterium]|nr:PQQ-like beta-propeller repeat protein [Thermoanaerobaculia bacterium]